MIASASASDGYALLSRLSDNGAAVRQRLSEAQQQVSTGRVSDTYAGLGAAARTSLSLRPQIAHQAAWQSNIDAASVRLDVTQTALKGIEQIASDFYAKTADLNHLGASQTDAVAASAKLALTQVAQLLNTKSGDVYVFAGQDTANPPVPDTSAGVLSTALLASDTASAPFSATLGTAVPEVEVGEGQRVQVGLLANRNTLTSAAAPTTGSYMRDIMRALSTLAGVTDGPSLESVAADTRARLGSAMKGITAETGVLGQVQSSLTTRRAELDETTLALTKQVSAVEDVDMASALTKVSALQTQLQASYQMLASAKDLSLAKFL